MSTTRKSWSRRESAGGLQIKFKIALRLDEPAQADLVLGDGARDRGVLCDEIAADPATGAGVGYVRLEADPDPVRVRAAFVTDDDIRAMTAAVTDPAGEPAPAAGEAR